MASFGTRGWLVVWALSLGPSCVTATPLGTFRWDEYETRSVGTPMPVAPPVVAGRRIVDFSIREMGATTTTGGELAGHPETGVLPLRTDGALTSRLSRFAGLRVLGSLGYGQAIGPTREVPYPGLVGASGGLGLVLGWWGDDGWSLVLEVDTLVVALANRDRYERVEGPCFRIEPVLFGSDGISCSVARRLDHHTFYEGMALAPALGATLDLAGWPLDWLRIGGGGGVQEHVSRSAAGGVHHEPIGIARLFVELHVADVWVGVEAQQWIADGVSFSPSLGITLGGAAFDRRGPEPDVVEPENVAPRRAPVRVPYVPSAPATSEPVPEVGGGWLPVLSPP